MRTSDAVRLAAGGLKERKTRTVLTLLGIVIGTSMIVALLSVTQGASNAIAEDLDALGPTTLVVAPAGSRLFNDLDVQRIQRIDGVKGAYGGVGGSGIVTRAGESTRVTIVGLDPIAMEQLMPGVEIAQGDWIASNDATGVTIGANVAEPPAKDRTLARLRDVVVVSVDVPSDSLTGPTSVLSTRQYRVVGIAERFGSSPFFDVDGMVLMTPRAASQLLQVDGYNQITVVADSVRDVARVQSAIEDQFRRGNTQEAIVFSGAAIASAVGSVFGVIGAVLGGIAAISLIVAGVGIANTMLVSVLERVTEIGTMKALGFRSREVLSVFLLEAGLTGFIGGVLGAVLGVALSFGVVGALNSLSAGSPVEDPGGGPGFALQIAPSFDLSTIAWVLLFAIGVSMLAGLLPSRKAARLDPVVALKRL